MSISDGLGPSIFCRKMEKARPMREEMDGKIVYFPPESALLPLMLYFSTVLFPICTLTWRANNYVSRREKGKSMNRRNESTTSALLGNSTEFCRTFESHSREHFIIFQVLFRTFSETLKNCIQPSSD